MAFVIDVHALLALARGFHHRAIGVEDRFLEKRLGLLRQTFSRVALNTCCKRKMSAVSKRRQKSPAVVGSGMRRAPRASR